MKTYDFSVPGWEKDFNYVYSLVAGSFEKFKQDEKGVVNSFNEKINGYDYVSIAHKDMYSKGVKLSARCSFDAYGAPLLTFANSVFEDENGHLRYGEHYEVVAYENGCNVWHIAPAPAGAQKPFVVKNCLRLRFKIADASEIKLSAEVLDGVLRVEVNEASFDIPVPLLSEKFYIALTACEGINHFYSAEISE